MRRIDGDAIEFDQGNPVIAVEIDDQPVDRLGGQECQRRVAIEPFARGIDLERQLGTFERHRCLLRRKRQAAGRGGPGQRRLFGLRDEAG